MEFTVRRNSLLQALQHCRLTINKNNALPAFESFVLTFRNDCQLVLTVHASNSEIFMKEDVVLDGLTGDMRPISIYYLDLLRAIKALDDQPLRFDIGEMQMTVYHEIGSFRLPLNNSCNEFLSWKAPSPDCEAKDCHSMSYEAPVLASILNRCSYAMAQDLLRPVMNGVHFNLTANYADYVTSDGHCLVRVRKHPMKDDLTKNTVVTSIIIPSRIVSILQRVLPKTGDVDIDYQEPIEKKGEERKAQCCITIGFNLEIVFNPIEGRYPNYLAVFPEHNQYEMLIDRRKLTKSLDRLVLFANESNMLVRMTISHDNLQLHTDDVDFAFSGDETLPCESNINDSWPLKIGMKATSLSKTLKTMSTEKVAIHLEDSSRAVILNPVPQPDNEELTYLLMPMICND
jgi:DNA polymerase-3 subunit beta